MPNITTNHAITYINLNIDHENSKDGYRPLSFIESLSVIAIINIVSNITFSIALVVEALVIIVVTLSTICCYHFLL